MFSLPLRPALQRPSSGSSWTAPLRTSRTELVRTYRDPKPDLSGGELEFAAADRGGTGHRSLLCHGVRGFTVLLQSRVM